MLELDQFVGKKVVVDTKTSYLFIGILEKIGESFLTINEVDVHDHNDFSKTKELYIMEAAKYDIKVNRKSTKVIKAEIISISLLSDIVQY